MPRKNKPRSMLVVTVWVPIEWRPRYSGFDLRRVSDGILWAHVYQDGAWIVYDEDGGNSDYGGQATTPALARRAVEKALGVRRVKA